jgi:hypothetical protein
MRLETTRIHPLLPLLCPLYLDELGAYKILLLS